MIRERITARRIQGRSAAIRKCIRVVRVWAQVTTAQARRGMHARRTQVLLVQTRAAQPRRARVMPVSPNRRAWAAKRRILSVVRMIVGMVVRERKRAGVGAGSDSRYRCILYFISYIWYSVSSELLDLGQSMR
jgi:hypothetical protein